jgi:succinate dehydrogenase / fumarate reductase membrane anchor subunit
MTTPSPSSLRSPASRVRHLGAARSGTGDNWLMRVTSAALVPLTIFFVWIVLELVGKDYNTARMLVGTPLVAIVLIAFIIVCALHMRVGMKSILMDYLHHRHVKEWALIINTIFASLVALVGVYAVLRIGLD